MRYLLQLPALALILATATLRADVIGTEFPQLKLADGKTLAHVKFLGCPADTVVSVKNETALHTIPLDLSPEPLRAKTAAEGAARREADRRYNIYRRSVRPPPPP